MLQVEETFQLFGRVNTSLRNNVNKTGGKLINATSGCHSALGKNPPGPALVGGSLCLRLAAGAAPVQKGHAVPVAPGGFRTTSEAPWARFLKSDDSRVINALRVLPALRQFRCCGTGLSIAQRLKIGAALARECFEAGQGRSPSDPVLLTPPAPEG